MFTMTSEEFAQRFQDHPLGFVFQALEAVGSVPQLESNVSMAEGMLLLLEFQGEIREEEREFLREALQGNAQRNLKRIKKTNSPGLSTKQ